MTNVLPVVIVCSSAAAIVGAAGASAWWWFYIKRQAGRHSATAQLAAEARTDALTLLANRRALDEELARRAAELELPGGGFAIILADVDRFKDLNDAHGHPTGDELLRAAAELLRRTMRRTDMVARYGGDEFAVILPDTSLPEACKAAVRACETVERACIAHDGGALRMTVSFGVALAHGNSDAAAILRAADQALYAAKAAGRNCVFVHDRGAVRRVFPNPPDAPQEA